MPRGPAVRPHSLNTAMAVLFMIGSACFALGTVPAYVAAVGTATDAGTFFLGSVFFTSASFCQLLQAQSPGMAPDAVASGRVPVRFWAPAPADRGWLSAAVQFPGTIAFNVSTGFALATSLTLQQTDRLVWAPDFVGSILFLIASWFGIAAVSRRFFQWSPRDPWWGIAWINMLGSVFFMFSAIGALVLPATGAMANVRWANAGTFAGAVCFFIGAALLLPSWRRAALQGSH
jgi:hypothetical protein